MTFRSPRTDAEHRAMRRHVQRPATLQKQCDEWNAANQVGAEVEVLKDNGAVVQTKTRGKAYVMSGHTAVIFLEGISGCYLLGRVRRADRGRE